MVCGLELLPVSPGFAWFSGHPDEPRTSGNSLTPETTQPAFDNALLATNTTHPVREPPPETPLESFSGYEPLSRASQRLAKRTGVAILLIHFPEPQRLE